MCLDHRLFTHGVVRQVTEVVRAELYVRARSGDGGFAVLHAIGLGEEVPVIPG